MVDECRNNNVAMRRQIDALSGEKPRLLLHCCCGPCATAVIERLIPHFSLTLYYYNPNTWPKDEYDKRLEVLQEYVRLADISTEIVAEKYVPDEYLKAVENIADKTEGGARCAKCISLRLEKTAKFAAENNFDYFASTLSVSPRKNADVINDAGAALEKKYNIKYLYNDFKKEDGYKRSVMLSRQFNLYRQDYCGCEVSKMLKEKQNG